MESKLQIISGTKRGLKLSVPADARPTQNRARIALCNMLNQIIDKQPGALIWDAFAGSGAFAFEFLSRNWAQRAILTDTNTTAIKTIRTNAKKFDANKIQIEQTDAIGAIKKFGAISNIIFVDPPYSEHKTGESFIRKISSVVKIGTIIVWETEIGNLEIDTIDFGFNIVKDKNYGRARFLILEKVS